MASAHEALVKASVAAISSATEEANRLATAIRNAGNEAILIQEVREASDDEQIVKFREWVDQVMAKVMEKQSAIDAYIVEQGMVDTTPIDVEAATAEYKVNAEQAKAFMLALKSIPGVDMGALGLPELQRLPGARGGAGGGTGPRPRIAEIKLSTDNGQSFTDVFDNIKNKDTGEEERKTGFSVLARVLSSKDYAGTKVEVKDLHSAAFEAAGTTDFSSLNGKPIEFVFNCGTEGAQRNYFIQIVPRVMS